jgi:hypothetical protein
MRVYYLDCHEARLCCSLVLHIGNLRLLRQLQLFYFHLWTFYWITLIHLVPEGKIWRDRPKCRLRYVLLNFILKNRCVKMWNGLK